MQLATRVIACLGGLLLLAALTAFGAEDAGWQSIAGGRYRALKVPEAGKTGFRSLNPQETGIVFTNVLPQERHLTNQIFLNGSGFALGDVDGDGWCDLYVAALGGTNQMFRNLGGWKFTNVTAQSGAGLPARDSTGAVMGDVDGDGDLDLIVSTIGQGTHVLFNDGSGRFTEPALNAGLNARRAGMSMALADLDGDGDLDLYITNYRTDTLRDMPNSRFSFTMTNGSPVPKTFAGQPFTNPEISNRFAMRVELNANGTGVVQFDENGEAHVLCLNDGQGKFTPVSWTDGRFRDEAGEPLKQPTFDWGLSVMLRDMDGNGTPDIYVCNDFKTPDRIWLNDGRANFRAAPKLMFRQIALSSMGVDFADINRDGHDDIIALDMLAWDRRRRFSQRMEFKPEATPPGVVDNRPQVARNMLYLARGDGTFAEIAHLARLDATDWSWTPIFLDVDLDGYEDLLVSNGFERDNMNVDVLQTIEADKKARQLSNIEQLHLRKRFPRLTTSNLAFRNRGDLRFEEVTAAWGFTNAEVSQAMAMADFDNDGDEDIVVGNLNGPLELFRNESAAPRLRVAVKGEGKNTRGVGAKIEVKGGPVAQSQQIIAGGRYLASDEMARTFAAGKATNLEVTVTWRSGKTLTLAGVPVNSLVVADETNAVAITRPLPVVPRPLFKDVTAMLGGHRHAEEPFDDFARQPLAPLKLSQNGPGVVWCDVNADGWDDLIVGAGRGGTTAVWTNDGKGVLQRWEAGALVRPQFRDQAGLVALRRTNAMVLLAGASNYEDGMSTEAAARSYDFSSQKWEDAIPGTPSSTGPLALVDVNGDGELDLFVGGRAIPGRYAEAASSAIYRGTNGSWVLDGENFAKLANVGLVSGAVWSDLDGDGDAELVLACDWGPVRVFRNDAGKLAEATQEWGLAAQVGRWNGVATGDFDGDGRMDIVASNWGSNTRHERFRAQPIQLFYGDIGMGNVAVVEGWHDPVLGGVAPSIPFHVIGNALPFLRPEVGSFTRYGNSTLDEIYGRRLKLMGQVQANWLESAVFLNRGGRFEARALPVEAQFSVALAVCVADFDNDGNEDVFLSQNFFSLPPEVSRMDAGRGLLLSGDGKGGFSAMEGIASGIVAYGEQRGAAAGDFDGDGRVDLVLAQNGAETMLFRNEQAPVGLRVRLEGPGGNRDGIGVVIRPMKGDKNGAAREVHAGSGFYSQDSVVQVFAPGVNALKIRWPGAGEKTVSVPEGSREVIVNVAGDVKRLR